MGCVGWFDLDQVKDKCVYVVDVVLEFWLLCNVLDGIGYYVVRNTCVIHTTSSSSIPSNKCKEFLDWLTKYEVLTFQGGCFM